MNERIQSTIDLTKQVLGDARGGGQKCCCSVSGGADSDILIDLCERTEPHFCQYVFFDTGIEYPATKEHLDWLEQKYGIEIHRENAKIPVPLGNKRYGKPFLSKQVSEYIHRLQIHDFAWEDKSYEELIKEYPNCQIALKWWCNRRGDNSAFNIGRNVWLKEFMVKNPPTFKISPKCCDGAKKNPAAKYIKENKIDIQILGIRLAEGGARTFSHKDFFQDEGNYMKVFPILYFSNKDRAEYEREFDIVHSKCYTEYGLQRTGCCGCCYSRNYNFEREVLKKYEPKLSKVIENMWEEVYDYTDKYHEFQRIMNLKYKKNKKCACGCTKFTGDDVAMNLKYFGRDVKTLLCRKCFMEVIGMSDEQWDDAIEGFKAQGCELF